MHFRDLPPSEMIGKTRREDRLAALLEQAAGRHRRFTHWEEVAGIPQYGRLLLTADLPKARMLDAPLDANEAAREMHVLRKTALYVPASADRASKGWQVRVTRFCGSPAAILLAEWISYKHDE